MRFKGDAAGCQPDNWAGTALEWAAVYHAMSPAEQAAALELFAGPAAVAAAAAAWEVYNRAFACKPRDWPGSDRAWGAEFSLMSEEARAAAEGEAVAAERRAAKAAACREARAAQKAKRAARAARSKELREAKAAAGT